MTKKTKEEFEVLIYGDGKVVMLEPKKDHIRATKLCTIVNFLNPLKKQAGGLTQNKK